MIIFLDTELLWLIGHPKGGPDSLALRLCILRRVESGDRFAVAEICDYEARRELLRKKATRQLELLDELISESIYVPLVTQAMKTAASEWARLRQGGRPGAPNHALDGDVILGAQAKHYAADHIVATANVRHLSRLCNAQHWRDL